MQAGFTAPGNSSFEFVIPLAEGMPAHHQKTISHGIAMILSRSGQDVSSITMIKIGGENIAVSISVGQSPSEQPPSSPSLLSRQPSLSQPPSFSQSPSPPKAASSSTLLRKSEDIGPEKASISGKFLYVRNPSSKDSPVREPKAAGPTPKQPKMSTNPTIATMLEEMKKWPVKSVVDDVKQDELDVKAAWKPTLVGALHRLRDILPDATSLPVLSPPPQPAPTADEDSGPRKRYRGPEYSDEHFLALMKWADTPLKDEPEEPTTPSHIIKILTDWM